MPFYTISAIERSTGAMTDEVVEAVDLEMVGEILAARGLSIVSVVGTASKDPRLLSPQPAQQPPMQPPMPPHSQQMVIQQKSVFGGVVMALLFVFIGIPFIIFVVIPLTLIVIALIFG